jgi:O-antigen/teichoic acid export membrane protein
VLLPKISKNSSNENDHLKTLSLWKKMITINALITIPTLVFCIIMAKSIIITLFSAKYSESANIFRITIMVFIPQMTGYGYILRGHAKTKQILMANTFRLLFSVIAGYFLIMTFGVIGAAITFTVSFSINAGYQLFITKKIIKIRLKELLPWKDIFIIFGFTILPSILLIGINQLKFHVYVNILLALFIFPPIVFIFVAKSGYMRYFDFIKLPRQMRFIKLWRET